MPKGTCTVDGCDRPYRANHLCDPHNQRLTRHGDVQADIPIQTRAPRTPPDLLGDICRVNECSRKALRRGYCMSHWRRWNRDGEAGLAKPIQPKVRPADAACAATGCDRPVVAVDLCRTHYQRQWRSGDARLDVPIYKAPAAPGSPCLTEGCTGLVFQRGLCTRHWGRDRMAAIRQDPVKYDAHRAYHRAHGARRYAKDSARILELQRNWMKANPDRKRTYNQRSRLLRGSAPRIPYTAEQLRAKMEYWGNRCWMCDGPFENVDHVKPLARGGADALMNLRPACRSCNARKHARWPIPLQRRQA